MSTSAEINEVFEQEIAAKTKYVENKFGKLPFYDGCKNMRIFKLYDFDPSWTKYQGEK
jgi:hypothetical protein